MRGEWLFHPDSPGLRVYVVRSWLGWLIKDPQFATHAEVKKHTLFIRAARIHPPRGVVR